MKKRVSAAALGLCEQCNCRVSLTWGAQTIGAAEAGKFFEVGFEALKPLNTTGSGDAFTAGLAAALGEGASLAAAVAQGARCGALNAGLLRIGSIR